MNKSKKKIEIFVKLVKKREKERDKEKEEFKKLTSSTPKKKTYYKPQNYEVIEKGYKNLVLNSKPIT